MRWESRRRARRLLVQALYQRQLTGHTADEIEAQFSRCRQYAQADAGFFGRMLRDVCRRSEALDRDIAAASDIPPHRIDPVERAILWSALAELQTREVGDAIAINEAIELCREFGAEHSYRFVNAVLDRWVRDRPPPASAADSDDGE